MTREEVYERLNGVFREILDDDSIELHDETVADDVDGWDSFEHINLIVGVEEEFEFKIPLYAMAFCISSPVTSDCSFASAA